MTLACWGQGSILLHHQGREGGERRKEGKKERKKERRKGG